MRRRPLSARCVLVVAPHPDDEAIGAWALMRKLGRARARLELLVVSDGAASHPGSVRWPPPRLARERRRETLRAMATLGLVRTRVRFLGLPDGALEAQPARLRGAIAATLRRVRPDLLVGPVASDGHGDHRAVARAIARLRRAGECRLGYQVWPAGAARSASGCHVPLDGRDLAAKRRIVRSYRTQTGMITDAAAGFAMTARHLKAFVRPVERFVVLA